MTARRSYLPDGMTPRLLNRDQAAAYCGVGLDTFEEHVAFKVKSIVFGKHRLWDVRALDAWLDAESGLAPIIRPTGSLAERLTTR